MFIDLLGIFSEYSKAQDCSLDIFVVHTTQTTHLCAVSLYGEWESTVLLNTNGKVSGDHPKSPCLSSRFHTTRHRFLMCFKHQCAQSGTLGIVIFLYYRVTDSVLSSISNCDGKMLVSEWVVSLTGCLFYVFHISNLLCKIVKGLLLIFWFL